MKLHPTQNHATDENGVSRSSLSIVVIADVGNDKRRHLGDEAMLEANLEALRRLVPDVAFTIVCSDPAWTFARYGVAAVSIFGFSGEPSATAERTAMLARLLSDAKQITRGDNASDISFKATITAIADADGLIVSGGGNLSSTWPDLLYERVALLQLARLFGKPSVVLGQTIGPQLTAAESHLLAQALSSVTFLGVRELPSAGLAGQLGVTSDRIRYQSDDALFLQQSDNGVNQFGALPADAAGFRIAVTIDPQLRAAGSSLFDDFVSQLRKISVVTGASFMLIPHAFGDESEEVPSDLTEAKLLAGELGLQSTIVAAGLDARQAMQLTGEAAMIISTRYHPIVFGLAGGVPSIGIYGDEYCRIKLQGALVHAGLERWLLTYDDVRNGELLKMALRLWSARDQIRREIESRRAAWAEEYRQRWAEVLRAFDRATRLGTALSDAVRTIKVSR